MWNFCLGQKCLTFRGIVAVAVFTWPEGNNTNYYCSRLVFTLTMALFPRILFSVLIIAQQRDLLSHKQPKNPKRRVSVSINLVGMVYNAIRSIFKHLNGSEQLALQLCQYFQYIFLQLLGYSYNDEKIILYSELETFAFVCSYSYLYMSTVGLLPVDLYLILTLYLARILLQRK